MRRALLGVVAAWALELGETEAAAQLQGGMDGLREEAGRIQPAPYEQFFDEATREGLIAALGADGYQRELERGRALDLDHAIDAALAVIDSAGTDVDQGFGA